jgi:hypothetical protein
MKFNSSQRRSVVGPYKYSSTFAPSECPRTASLTSDVRDNSDGSLPACPVCLPCVQTCLRARVAGVFVPSSPVHRIVIGKTLVTVTLTPGPR